MELPRYLSEAIEEMPRPRLHVMRDESVPRDQIINVSASVPGGPALVANSWMIIEIKNIYRGGRRIDPDAWFADILEEIQNRIEVAAMLAVANIEWGKL